MELVRSKQQANRTDRYTQSLKQFLLQFCRGRELKPIGEFTTEDVSSWLDQYPNPNTRRTWLTRLSTLFEFARRKKYIETNICNDLERIASDRNFPKILTPGQVDLLLSHCPIIVLPALILGIFVGLRPEEIAPRKLKGKPRNILDWSAINLETKTVTVKGKRRWRTVPLEDRAIQLLRPLAKPSGPVVKSHSTVRNWRIKARKLMGWAKWPCDIERHTCASMLYALHGDAALVRKRLGHSESVCWNHYLAPVTASDCAKFWSINQPNAPSTQLQLKL